MKLPSSLNLPVSMSPYSAKDPSSSLSSFMVLVSDARLPFTGPSSLQHKRHAHRQSMTQGGCNVSQSQGTWSIRRDGGVGVAFHQRQWGVVSLYYSTLADLIHRVCLLLLLLGYIRGNFNCGNCFLCVEFHARYRGAVLLNYSTLADMIHSVCCCYVTFWTFYLQ